MLLIFLFSTWGNWGLGRLRAFLQATKLLDSEARAHSLCAISLFIPPVNPSPLPPSPTASCSLAAGAFSYWAPLTMSCHRFACLCLSLDWELPEGRDMFYLSLYPSAHLSTWPRICVLNDFCWRRCIGFFFDSCWLILLKSHIPSTQTHPSCDISTYSWVWNGVMCILRYQLKQLFFFQTLVYIKSF